MRSLSPRRPGAALTWVLGAAVMVGFALTMGLVASPTVVLGSILEKAIFVTPGLLLVRAVCGPSAGWLPVVAFGPAIGFGASSLALTGLWLAGARGLWILAAAPAIVTALVLPFASRLRGRWNVPVTVAGDRGMMLALLLLVVIVVSAPFSNVGRHLPEGQAYRAYFTADYVWRRAVVSELAKGSVLPVNPFFRGDSLHYYWMPHLATAVVYRDTEADLDSLLLLDSVIVDAGFVAFLYGLARWFAMRPGAAALGVTAALMATSYEGLYALIDHWRLGVPLSLVRYLNIDAVSRWQFGGMPIDGLQRVLFYQPHHAVGYALGFLGVLAVCGRVRRHDPAAMAVAGTLLGLSTLISSFAGLMLTVTAALYEACSVLRHRDWWRGLVHAASSALPLALAAGLVTALEYVDSGGTIISVGANPIAFHHLAVSTALSFGPMLIVTGFAAWIAWRYHLSHTAAFVALATTCVFFYFFVDVRDHQNVYVGWRVGHLWFIACTALAAIVVEWGVGLPSAYRRAAIISLGFVLVAGLPTTLIDIYNTQDITNRARGPGFPWTLVLTDAELAGFDWIKRNTPPTALMQVDPLARGTEGWAYLPAFAERRMGVGLPISMVPLGKYEGGSRVASTLFDIDVPSAHDLARRNGVQYLVVGQPERERHPGVQERFDGEPAYLEPMFRNDAMAIYRVR